MLVAPGLAVRGKSPADRVHAALSRTLIAATSGTPPTRVIAMSTYEVSHREPSQCLQLLLPWNH
ncbi:hypothetical protein VTN00DRAFT_1122 [Thermoascus crustaceus]|uniref:uncharacterized protein n=1 Tax=Thermoascus crustaceus TaxID=5088 RepID=UPI003743E278